jgi:hypothetical protein
MGDSRCDWKLPSSGSHPARLPNRPTAQLALFITSAEHGKAIAKQLHLKKTTVAKEREWHVKEHHQSLRNRRLDYELMRGLFQFLYSLGPIQLIPVIPRLLMASKCLWRCGFGKVFIDR